jgi:hypothetical protein
MDWPTVGNAGVSKSQPTSLSIDLDLQLAKKLLHDHRNRVAVQRHYATNRKEINERRRRKYAECHPWINDTVVIGKQNYFGRKWLAHTLKITTRTLDMWVMKGFIPEGRIIYKGKQFYHQIEVGTIISAYRLAGSSLKGIAGPNKIIIYKRNKTTFKRLVWDEILELRRNEQWKKS